MKFAASAVLLLATILAAPHHSDASSRSGSKNIEQYRKALELDPSDSKARYYLGISLLQNGDYTGGVEELLKVYPGRNDDPEINFNIGYAYLQMGQNDDAFRFFGKILELGDEYGKKFRLDSAYLRLGFNYRSLGNEEKSILCFNNSLEVNPENIRTYLLLASMHSKMGDNGKAVEYLERARSLDDKDEELIRLSTAVHSRLGVDYLGKKMYPEARKEFEKVSEMDSSHLYTIYYLGYLDYLVGDFNGAARNLEKLTSLKIEDENLKSGLKPLLLNLGVHYLQGDDPERALEVLESVEELFPDYSKARYYAGVAALKMSEFDRAIVELEGFLKLEPSDAGAATQLGLAYDRARELHFERGKDYFVRKIFKESLDEFNRVLDISPDYGPALKYREIALAEVEKIRKEEEKRIRGVVASLMKEGRDFLEEGELIAARKKFLDATELDPADREAERALRQCQGLIDGEIRRNMDEGNRHLGRKDYHKAAKSFGMVLYYDPDNRTAADNLQKAEQKMKIAIAPLLKEADKFIAKNLFREALDRYDKALRINPEDESALAGKSLAKGKVDLFFNEYLGMARDYRKVVQLSLAMDYYNKALELKPGDETVLNELAVVQQKMGRVRSIGDLLKDARTALVRGRFNEAITGFSAVLKLNAENQEAKKGLLEARYRKKNKVDSMVAKAESLFKKGRHHETVDLCKNILVLDRNEDRASRLLKKATKEINSVVNPHIASGKKMFDGGNINGAILEFKKALNNDPANSIAKRYLSRIDSLQVKKVIDREVKKRYLSGLDAYTKGRYEDALLEWGKVLEVEPDHEKAGLNIEKARRKLAAMKGR